MLPWEVPLTDSVKYKFPCPSNAMDFTWMPDGRVDMTVEGERDVEVFVALGNFTTEVEVGLPPLEVGGTLVTA